MNQTLCVDIPIERDAILEHTEEFRTHLSSHAHRVTITRESAVVAIVDDGNVTVEFGSSEYSVSEDTETEVELCVMLRGVLEREVLVNVTTVTDTATGGLPVVSQLTPAKMEKSNLRLEKNSISTETSSNRLFSETLVGIREPFL